MTKRIKHLKRTEKELTELVESLLKRIELQRMLMD